MSPEPRRQPKVSFPTDYRAILDRVQTIDPIRYATTRNYIDGDVTYLSPYISRGVISVKLVRDLTIARGYDPSSIGKFLQELAWREYFQRVWEAKGNALFRDLRQVQPDVAHNEMISTLVEASTGIEAIDRAIKDFYDTGYLHNHVRMYIASIACNVGKAHWSSPARWMYAHLLDGDLASNTCSWQWVAGAFSSKKYWCDQGNINRHMHSTQRGTFLDSSLELIQGGSMPARLRGVAPWKMIATLPKHAPVQLDARRKTLVYNSYNLDPTWRQNEEANRVLLLEPSHFDRFPVSEKVIDFILSLASNIEGIQVMVGEVEDLLAAHGPTARREEILVSKEHPAFLHYPGRKDPRDWMFPHVKGYFPSFSAYWRMCER